MLLVCADTPSFLGIDVYLRLPRLGTNLESIEI